MALTNFTIGQCTNMEHQATIQCAHHETLHHFCTHRPIACKLPGDEPIAFTSF